MNRPLPPSVVAALRAAEHFARGGMAGLGPMFPAIPLPTVATPGLASPRGLVGAHHRQHFANGGLPHHVLAALGLRPHFLDGGSAGGGDGDGEGSSRSGGSSSSGGDNGGDGHGNGGESSSSSSSSGSAGGVGGMGGASSDGYGGGSSGGYGGVGGIGGSNDGYGGGSSSSSTSSGGGFNVGSSGSSSSSTSSGSSGGVGGIGGGGSDGYGGGNSSSSSSSNSNASSGSAGGVGGMGGGASDGYGGGSSGGTQTSGGFSSGAASGSDSGGVGGSVGSGGVMGGGGLSGSSVGSGDVGSMAGSYGAPSPGGFSTSGNTSGGFGSFGAGSEANDTSAGLTGATPSASMMSGQTAAQSMASEAASGGEAGEDGTGSMNGASTAGAFGSFGSTGSVGLGSVGPYGSMANAQSAFGGSSASDGTVGATPSSVGMSNPDAVGGLYPSGQMMGVMGMGGVDSGIAGMTNVGAAGVLNGPGAYGLSTMNRDGSMPGFDNFGAKGDVTQSSLGGDGYGGTDLGSVNPAGSYTTPSGIQTGALTGALQGGLPSAEGYVGSYAGLSPNMPASVAVALGAPTTAQTPDATHGVDPAVIGGMFGNIGDIFGGITSPGQPAQAQAPAQVASPYGTMSQTPMGPALTGSLQQAMGTDRTSDTAGLNADGDPTAVNGMSALTVHGTLTPGAQAMSDGVPAGVGVHTQLSPSYAATDGLAANRVYSRTADSQDSGVGASMIASTALSRDPQSLGMGFNPSSMTNTSFGPSTPDTSAPSITDSQVAQARQNLANGTGTDEDRATVRDYLVQQNASAGAAVAAAAPTTTPAQVTSTTPGIPDGSYYAGMHKIEGGVLNGQVDPNNPTHYGPAQFSQATWSGVARNNPDLGLPSSMFSATPEQYSKATEALTQENATALQNAGLPVTPANLYTVHNLGAPMGIAALQAGPDASLTAAGISPAIQQANPSIYGGVSTIGELQSKLDAKFADSATPMGTPSAPAQPAITVHSIGAALGDGTAAQIGRYTGVQNGVGDLGNAGLGGLGGMGTMGTGDFGAAEAANTGKFGTVTAHDYSVPGIGQSGMFGEAVSTAHDAPSVPAFAGMAGRNAASDGTIANEGMGTPSSERGYTDFDGNPVEYGGLTVDPNTSNTTTPDTAPADGEPQTLTVNPKVANILAGMGLGMLGPVGAGVGAINSISGLLGGPTIGGGINAVLAHPGSPTGVTGGGDNSNQPGSQRYGSSMPAQVYAPQDSGSGTAATTSTGVNPLDPHATAMAAYQAALAGMGKGSGTTSSTTDMTDAPRPLLIRGRPVRQAAVRPLYKPMEDPIVRRALGLA